MLFIIFHPKNGSCDRREMNGSLDPNSVQGAAVPHVNEAVLSEEARYIASQTIGKPTEQLGGVHISHYQNQRRPAGGGRCQYIVTTENKSASQNCANRVAAAAAAGRAIGVPAVAVISVAAAAVASTQQLAPATKKGNLIWPSG